MAVAGVTSAPRMGQHKGFTFEPTAQNPTCSPESIMFLTIASTFQNYLLVAGSAEGTGRAGGGVPHGEVFEGQQAGVVEQV